MYLINIKNNFITFHQYNNNYIIHITRLFLLSPPLLSLLFNLSFPLFLIIYMYM